MYCVFIIIQPPKARVSSNCDQKIAYSKEICSSELQYWQQCFSQQANADIYIPSNIDPQQTEERAKSFFFGLPSLSPSPKCVDDLRPFLCLYLFGSCDSNNQSHQITQADCERLRDDVCAQEWAKAESFLGRGALPQCSDFPNQEELCPSKASTDYARGGCEISDFIATPTSVVCSYKTGGTSVLLVNHLQRLSYSSMGLY